jgi:hypothetical protein
MQKSLRFLCSKSGKKVIAKGEVQSYEPVAVQASSQRYFKRPTKGALKGLQSLKLGIEMPVEGSSADYERTY